MKTDKKMTVGKKLMGAFFLMILISIIIGLIGYRSSAKINTNVERIFTVFLPGLDYLIEADRDLQQLLVAERTMAMVGADKEIFKELLSEYEENKMQSEQRFEKYNKLHTTEEETGIIKEYETARKKWEISTQKVLDGLTSGDEASRENAIELTLGEAKNDFEVMRDYIDQLTELNLKIAEDEYNASGEIYRSARNSIFIITVVAFFGGMFLVWMLSNGITKALRRVIASITTGSDHVASASYQVSESSQSLAEGSSEMAASIEETSSSLEEISAMIRQSANNSKQADQLMSESKRVVEKANDFMEQLNRSMKEISDASEQTSKIVKTIDEIAFQTNLLALNAAVEAARAGEAGAGFAVVADEVRSLAMRAADAAKNTSDLIDQTVNKVNSGSDLSEATREEFNHVTESSGKVARLVGEIAAATEEQSEGIGQIGTAVDQMNSVIQKNAAGAEESASASEELNAQAEVMKQQVKDLISLVGTGKHEYDIGAGSINGMKSAQKRQLIAPVETKKAARPQKIKGNKEIPVNQVIPLEEKDFEDF